MLGVVVFWLAVLIAVGFVMRFCYRTEEGVNDKFYRVIGRTEVKSKRRREVMR